MILARPFFGILDISVLIAIAAIILYVVIRKYSPTWISRVRGWWEELKAKNKSK